MNHLFFPNRPKPATGKTGINRVRKIIKYEKKSDKNTDSTNNNLILHDSIPNPWFYNKNTAEKVWDGLEQTDKERQQLLKQKLEDDDNKENKENEKNPFFKIDKSTTKIRQLVDSFSVSDQEFLINLMEMLEDDAGIDSLDQQSILLEARLRLATMIDEHVGNSDAQSKMLDSLRVFFNDFQHENQNAIENEITNLSDFDTGVDSAQLATLINDACEKNEVCSEQASHIHKAIVDSFTRQMRDLKQVIDSRDKEIQNLKSQIDQHQKNRRNRRSDISARKIKEANQNLAGAQRKICEQQNTINNLKSALRNKSGDECKFSPTNSSDSLSNDKSLIQAMGDDIENGENLSSDREIELMSKIHYLTEQVQSLKAEISDNMKEMKEIKFTAIDLRNNLQHIERAKKTADQTISSLNEKYEFMENMYKKKLADAYSGGDKVLNEKSDNQIIANLRIEYENKIASIREQARQSQQQALDIAEKRHRMQMNDMLKSLENTDQSAALSEVMKNQESSINEVTERNKKQIIELKNMNNDKVKALTKQYEAKLMDAFKQNETLRLQLKDDIDASLLRQKIELEANFQKRLNNCEADADEKYERMRRKFSEKISSVENLNKKLINERDALRDALDDAQVVVDIPNAEDEFDDENEEEEDEYDNDSRKNDLDDEIKLFDKNWADQQVRKVKEEYTALMNQQRENILKTKDWELEQMRKDMIRGFEEQMAENRRNLISDLSDLRDKVSNSTSPSDACDHIDNMITNLIKGVEKQGEISDDIVNREPTIPLSEANEKIDELSKKIVEVSTENEFLRTTLGKISNNRNLKDQEGNDMVKIMRQSVAEEAEKINELLLENCKLREDLEKAKTEIKELTSQKEELFKQIDELKQTPESRENDKLKQTIEKDLREQKDVEKTEEVNSTSFEGSISMPVKPPYMIENVSNDDYNTEKSIECSKCGEKISINPIILQVSTVESPVVECPFCHEAVQINRTDIESPFQKDEFNDKQLEQIGKMENEIKNEVMNLIEMKKKMREGLDLSSCQQVIQIDNTKEANKTITLTSNFDITVFTLPPTQKVHQNKLNKDPSSVAKARSFSPSNNRLFTPEQNEKIQKMEEVIDKKIENLVDYKFKSSSKGSLSNIKIVDDEEVDPSLQISKEIFFDSSEKIPIDNKTAHFVIFEISPNVSSKKSGRMIASSQSCNIYRNKNDHVSFNSAFIKPPSNIHHITKFIPIEDDKDKSGDSKENEKENPELKSKFASGYDGTSLDGSQSPFTRSLADFITTSKEETVPRDQVQQQNKLPPLDQSSQNNKNDPNKNGFPPLEKNKTRSSLPHSNTISLQQLQQFRKPSLTRSAISSLDILPWERTTIEDAHIEKGGNVLARLQSQFLRSQQQQQQNQTQQQQQQQQTQQQEKEKVTNNEVFLTPEADIVSLQVSEVGYFSRGNSRPSSSMQKCAESPTNDNNKDSQKNAQDDDNLADLLFEKNKPTGDPKAIEEFRTDLESWKRQMNELKEQYKSMMNSYNEVNNMTHDLIQRHNEIVKVLTKALDTAMSLAKGDAEHPEALIEKMQEQSAYLTTAIREKEILHSQSNEQLLILNERMQEVMVMHGETAEKDEEINMLQKQLKSLTSKEKENMLKIHALEESEKASKENDAFQKDQINSMAEKLEIECKKNFDNQKVVDNLNIKIEQLQTELVISSKASEVDMTSVEPFVIFSINQKDDDIHSMSNNKYKGFGLQPKSSGSLNLSSTKLLPQADEQPSTEKTVDPPVEEDNEVIHVSSLNINKEKEKEKEINHSNSKDSFAVFQPEFSEESDNKMIYKASSSEQMIQDKVNSNGLNGRLNSDSNEGISGVQLAVNQTSTIGGRIVENQKAQNLKARIQQLESTLALKTTENSEVREELHTTQQHLFKLTNTNAKLEREVKRVEVQRELANKKLDDSIELVKTLSTENEKLRKLVEQYKQMSVKFAEDLKKASYFEQSKNIALLGEMKTRNLLRDIQKVDSSKYTLKSFAERQALSLARWEGKRRYMQEKERQKIMSALQALNFIKIDDKKTVNKEEEEDRHEGGLVRKKSLAPGMKVTTYNLKKKFEFDSQSESGSEDLNANKNTNIKLESDHSRSMPSFEEALKNANSHNQKVSKMLRLGIVANPLKV